MFRNKIPETLNPRCLCNGMKTLISDHDDELAHGSGAPPEVIQRAQDVIATISQTHEKVERLLAEVLTLQGRVAEQETRVSAARASLQHAHREIIDNLLLQDSPPIWSAAMSSSEGKNLVGASYNSFRRQLTALRAYAKRYTAAFAVHAGIIVLLFCILYWARPRVKRWIEEEPSFERLAPIFNVSIAIAVLFSYPFARLLYPLAPQLLAAALLFGALIAMTIVLRRLIERRLFPILNALLAFYLLEQLRAVAAPLQLLSRRLFLAEMLAAIFFLIWLIRSTVPEVQKDRSWRAIKTCARIALVVFSAALVANAFGYVAL
jgi:hypothetical protein